MTIIRFPVERRDHCASGATVEHPHHGLCEVLDILEDDPMRRLLYRLSDDAWVEADVRELEQVEEPVDEDIAAGLTDAFW
ncbi:hypothetical protein [Thioalkalivibrio sp. ALE20]|uniref:hypothetical protein n=1 Tax=Thioalkalivibrio sp. ALE20 TaxID=545275 RepID=UPI00037AA67A|nr:hypothetical protein [Thioalkalivibrio sp. ALE20]